MVSEHLTGFSSDLAGLTLLEGLSLGGGGEAALLRHAIAALLNAAHPDIDYPLTEAEIKSAVTAALASGAAAIEDLKDELDAFNNLGCGLSQNG